MPRLTDFSPKWVDHGDRKGLGLLMQSPEPKTSFLRILVLFSNPLDGGPPWPGESRTLMLELFPTEEERCSVVGCSTFRWTRTGNPPSADFETLSLSPSINAHSAGHFTITNGAW